MSLGKWRNALELTQLAQFIAMTRPGYPREEAERGVWVDGKRLDVVFLEVPGLNISSSYVRECVGENLTIRYIVPDAVREYINQRGLYR
jgi:nicotinate-nucleotide adenylyltransferase